ncbi:uncharacterized protein LOC134269747 [Saccostrea cucullata]|uniref:uncharacterized protein LOC134269747 n=1 Tax=Saccostrea cuccullata TaxID=36930 RepID=UPI002ED05C36
MACAASSRKKRGSKSKGGSATAPDVEDIICPYLDKNSWFKLGINIGFEYHQLTKLQQRYDNDVSICSKRMLQIWRETAVKHTLKFIPLLYKSLQSSGLDKIAETVLGHFSQDYQSSKQPEVWESLIQDLNQISFSDTDEDDVEDSSKSTTIVLQNCSGIAIGDNCVVTISQAKQELERNKGDLQKRNTILAGMLTSILNPNGSEEPKEMCLQKLESAFTKLYGTRKNEKKTFYEISGMKMKKFLQNNSEKFDVKPDKRIGACYVSCVPSSDRCEGIFDPALLPIIRGFRSPGSISSTCSSERTDYDSLSVESYETDQDWTVVNHKRHPRTQKMEKERNKVKTFQTTLGTSSTKETYASVTSGKRNCLYTSESSSFEKRKSLECSTKVEDFLKYVHNFKRGNFILFTARQTRVRYLEALAMVPWISVFDFDERSRTDGLLSMLEDKIKGRRSLYICTWKDPPLLSHHGTQWCMIKGSSQEADSKTPVEEKKWIQFIRESFERHLVEIANFCDGYTSLKLVFLWPEDGADVRFMHRALMKVEEIIDPQIIICDPLRCKTPQEESFANIMKPNFIMSSNVQDLCKCITEVLGERFSVRDFTYMLPTSDNSNLPSIDEPSAAELREDLEVLYLKNPYRKGNEGDYTPEELEKEGDIFFQGGNIPWFVFYEAGAGHFDAERDLTRIIATNIKSSFIDPFKSGKITIFHAPGSGGTTLGQRILWELKAFTPCVQVKMNTRGTVQSLLQKIETLFEKTNLPIILLVDGEDQQRMSHLYKLADRLIIILVHVRRRAREVDNLILKENEYLLPGNVSFAEASKLGTKFSSRCDTPQKKDQIDELVRDIKSGSKSHLMYEFGMTAYHEKFKGIRSFVKGYLLLEENTSKEFNPSQKILGILSLVYYYGQTSIPCQFFASLLGWQENYDVSFEDFPYLVRHFIVPSQNDSRENSIRISHYLIAKEILEQLLTYGKSAKDPSMSSELSQCAKAHLYDFVVMFLSEIKKRKSKSHANSSIIADILAKTIIFRDNLDVADNEFSTRRKLSKLLNDIDCKPPYSERVNIIKRLTEIFPDDANFHAHLGRIISICRPEDEEDAENCFENAVSLLKKSTKGKNGSELDEGTKHTLRHVYHMYGMFYLQRISKYTGRLHGQKRTTMNERIFKERKTLLLHYAKQACYFFKETRDLTILGCEEAHGYVGEISTRLKICEIVHRYMPYKDISDYLKATPDSEVSAFVTESITAILELFMQCLGSVDLDDLPSDFFQNIHWYNALFKDKAKDLQKLEVVENIHTRRVKAALIKLKYGREENLGTLESISSKQDICEIVRLCEMNFKDLDRGGITLSKGAIDLEHKDWLNAIRTNAFSNIYSVEDVILRMRRWYALMTSPNSTFYLFIYLTVLGIGGIDGVAPNAELLREASQLQEKLKKLSKSLSKPRKPKEWFGKGPGVKAIIPARKVHKSENGLVLAGESSTTHLAIFKGTICRPNTKRQTGYIQMDIGDNVFPIKVFFIPVRTGEQLVGNRYAGERVEFVLAFTFADGYEAYNVARLKKYECNQCKKKVEITSDRCFVKCSCGKPVNKMD